MESARQEVRSIQYSKIKDVVASVKNEVMEMIAKVAKWKGRLDLPIVSGKPRYNPCRQSMMVLAESSQRPPQS